MTDQTKKIILVVEDEKSLQGALYDKLTREGFSVIIAQNGVEGLEKSLNQEPDLILLDLDMPKLNGMEMLRELRKDDWGKSVPVIILTNLPSSDENINKDIAELEPTYYLAKIENGLEGISNKIKERLGVN
jgi:DNA-binding response OmpR family regulator